MNPLRGRPLEEVWYRPEKRSPWRTPLLVLAPIVVVAVLAAGLYLTQQGGGASPSPSVGPTASPIFDPSRIVLGQDVYAVALIGTDVVITDARAGSTTTLARVPIGTDTIASPPVPTGTFAFSMVCGTKGSEDFRQFLVGAVQPDRGPFTYSGPPVVGGVAGSGAFLFVLQPGASATEHGRLSDESGRPIFEQSFEVDLASPSVAQPSGCWVSG